MSAKYENEEVSIPKGSIKSSVALPRSSSIIRFQFQKVRLKAQFFELDLTIKLLFQFQKVRLKEKTKTTISSTILSVSIPKGSIKSEDFEFIGLSCYCFNSKRFD